MLFNNYDVFHYLIKNNNFKYIKWEAKIYAKKKPNLELMWMEN